MSDGGFEAMSDEIRRLTANDSWEEDDARLLWRLLAQARDEDWEAYLDVIVPHMRASEFLTHIAARVTVPNFEDIYPEDALGQLRKESNESYGRGLLAEICYGWELTHADLMMLGSPERWFRGERSNMLVFSSEPSKSSRLGRAIVGIDVAHILKRPVPLADKLVACREAFEESFGSILGNTDDPMFHPIFYMFGTGARLGVTLMVGAQRLPKTAQQMWDGDEEVEDLEQRGLDVIPCNDNWDDFEAPNAPLYAGVTLKTWSFASGVTPLFFTEKAERDALLTLQQADRPALPTYDFLTHM